MRNFLFFCAVTMGMVAMTQTRQVTGDVTGEGVVDITDLNVVINILLGEPTSDEIMTMSDVTGDGLIDIADVNHLINIMLGVIQPTDVFARLEADMVTVEGATFAMGTPIDVAPYSHAWERPVHSVTLPAFRVCRYEVTQDLWQAVMGSNPSAFKGARRPVERVSWDDAQAFVLKLVEMTGKPYRLLTEAEWEYAARGGQHQSAYSYAGGDDLSRVAWTVANAGGETHTVGQLQPNDLGLYDMSGNVLEWVQDTHANTYAVWPAANVWQVEGGEPVVRGGSWRWGSNYCRTTWRGYFPANASNNYLGLRLGCDINP